MSIIIIIVEHQTQNTEQTANMVNTERGKTSLLNRQNMQIDIILY